MAKILAIDVSHLFWRVWHATSAEEQSPAFHVTVQRCHELAAGDFQHVAICVDRPPYKRSELFPEYKSNRTTASNTAFDQLKRTIDRLKKDGFLVLESKGYEADDVLAGVVKWARGTHAVTIATNDKDLLQLVDDANDITVWSTEKNTRLTELDVEQKFGVMPHQMCDYLALCGDASDHIPGVTGIGPKNAGGLLAEHETMEGIYSRLEEIEPKGIREKLRAGQDSAQLSRDLVRLDPPELDYSQISVERVLRPWLAEDDEDGVDGEAVDGEPVEAQALAKSPPRTAVVTVEYSQGLEPQNAGDAYTAAKYMYQSGLYLKFKNRDAIWAVILRGRELGLGAGTALDNFHVIEGKPALSAQLMQALARKHRDCKYLMLEHGDERSATWETHRDGDPKPVKYTYTIEQAQKAGLLAKKGDNWKNRPDDMLRKTAAVKLIRIVYPEIAAGLYCPEELGESRD